MGAEFYILFSLFWFGFSDETATREDLRIRPPCFMTVPKPIMIEFGIHHLLMNCANYYKCNLKEPGLKFTNFICLIKFGFSLQSVVVSGAKASDETAYPKEAVKAYHEKPVPTHDKAATSHQKPKVIQQPSKK